jgi:pimeloyl-ACP methyl ester carboxylesterase
VFRRFSVAAPWRAAKAAFAAIILAAALSASTIARAGGSHLYIFLGFGNMSPGLMEFASKMEKRGIPSTVGSYAQASEFAEEAKRQYKSGRLSSIMIIGHSLGGGAAREMAAELKEASVPVRLLVALDPVGGPDVSSNVQRSVEIMHGDGEDHFSMIAARDRQLTGYVLGTNGSGTRVPRSAHARVPAQDKPEINSSYGAIN